MGRALKIDTQSYKALADGVNAILDRTLPAEQKIKNLTFPRPTGVIGNHCDDLAVIPSVIVYPDPFGETAGDAVVVPVPCDDIYISGAVSNSVLKKGKVTRVTRINVWSDEIEWGGETGSNKSATIVVRETPAGIKIHSSLHLLGDETALLASATALVQNLAH
jgi:hypothetical protein